ncbi:Z1 domain-containing protein [Micromonospora sp. NPDC049048]|uniref:Z1 domain-containing protein n=1 Tax=Micromonospora sp. NPDC049048 TaxID=3364263 RepID=UPI00371E9D05
MQIDANELALNMAEKIVLDLPRAERTAEKLREAANVAASAVQTLGQVDLQALVRELESRFVVWVPREITVSDPSQHEPWYALHREKITFDYWRRYEAWLGRRWRRPQAVEALDESTDGILDLLENPARPGPWDVRGMVYGQVQSGKTASYTGITCKAVDAGYQVVIVLTGVHESLRSQTQARLDREFLGFNSTVRRQSDDGPGLGQIGVGALGMKLPPTCISLTSTEQDFTTRVYESSAIDLRRVRLLVVAKKNRGVLENLIGWLSNFCDGERDGKKVITDAPLLLIDDEADNASVDTKKAGKPGLNDPSHKPTTINKTIRDLLELFDKRVYVGYTATPFANIFIPHDTDHPEHGKDLFPHSFVVALRPPSNYCGPETVFGLEDPGAGEVHQPLPVVRIVKDHQHWMPDTPTVHHAGYRPPDLMPATLVQAIDAFLLATATRKVRAARPGGRDDHNTMLVHVTRYTDTQGAVVAQIRHHLTAMRDGWGDRGEAGRLLRQRLERLWQKDFEPTYADLAARPDVAESVGEPVTFEEVLGKVPAVLTAAVDGVKAINGTATDILDYRSSTPATVVAVGGDKLSRGLTLEGLTVSYYLRASRTYDTLLQMGRWFGYRPGYLDVTRLYTTQELVDYYVHITRANRDLMDVVSSVRDQGRTPKDVGLRVLEGYGRLQVTAAAKMRSSKPISFSFSGVRAETLSMRTDNTAMETNMAQARELVAAIRFCPEIPREGYKRGERGLFHHHVPTEVVTRFLKGFAPSARNEQAAPENLVKYIEAQVRKGELVRWTVAVSGGSLKNTADFGDVRLPRVLRKPIGEFGIGDLYQVGVLVSPADEAIGLTDAQYEDAMRATEAEFRVRADARVPKRPSGRSLRRRRDPAEGLLLVYPVHPGAQTTLKVPVIGFAAAFPASDNAEHLRYRANQIFVQKLASSLRADEDDTDEDDA